MLKQEKCFLHRLLKKESENAVIFTSGLGLPIRTQREAFIARFADIKKLNYMALDTTEKAALCLNIPQLEEEATQSVQKYFSNKRLLFVGTCFGALLSMCLANRFPKQTDFVLLVSPLIDYSQQVDLVARIRGRIERRKRFAKTKDQLNMLCLMESLLKSCPADFFLPQQATYSGPVSILHPECDTVVPVANSLAMIKKLNRQNVSFKVLPAETHTLREDFKLSNPIRELTSFLLQKQNG